MQRAAMVFYKKYSCAVLFLFLFFFCAKTSFSDVTINILAVNATSREKNKEIKYHLPKGIKEEDVLDTAGLSLKYDVNEGSYYVYQTVSLEPKETKTYKVRIRDVWKIDGQEIQALEGQIEESLNLLRDTEYYDPGKIKKESLHQRIDAVLKEYDRLEGSVEERINRFDIFEKEINHIRDDVLSVEYWRTSLPEITEENILKLNIEIENPTGAPLDLQEEKYYLPSEVYPEHIVDGSGFGIHYDSAKQRSYLSREGTLPPGENAKYTVNVLDIWHIPQKNIDDLKDRVRHAYHLIEKTEYVQSADYLVKNIKKNLEAIEASQALEKNIDEHIRAYRTNKALYEQAQKDVAALEDLLRAVREHLERSPLKNVLQKITLLNTIAAIAAALFGEKPLMSTTWKIIIGVIVFVAAMTMIHFALWGRHSQGVKPEDLEEPESGDS